MALAAQIDVEQRLQWDITSEPDAVITTLIASAQALIELEIGRTVESSARVETLDGGAWSLFLKWWPVTSVTTVTEDAVALTPTTDFLWYPRGKLIRVSGGYQTYWRAWKPQSIAVAYVGGYLVGTHDAELAALRSICAEVVARAFKRGADNAAIPVGASGQIASVTLAGSDSVTYTDTSGGSSSSGGVASFIYLTEDERRMLHDPMFVRPRFGFA